MTKHPKMFAIENAKESIWQQQKTRLHSSWIYVLFRICHRCNDCSRCIFVPMTKFEIVIGDGTKTNCTWIHFIFWIDGVGRRNQFISWGWLFVRNESHLIGIRWKCCSRAMKQTKNCCKTEKRHAHDKGNESIRQFGQNEVNKQQIDGIDGQAFKLYLLFFLIFVCFDLYQGFRDWTLPYTLWLWIGFHCAREHSSDDKQDEQLHRRCENSSMYMLIFNVNRWRDCRSRQKMSNDQQLSIGDKILRRFNNCLTLIFFSFFGQWIRIVFFCSCHSKDLFNPLFKLASVIIFKFFFIELLLAIAVEIRHSTFIPVIQSNNKRKRKEMRACVHRLQCEHLSESK